ncbi:MAG TPA: hypothetical protein VFE50_25200 [Cyclobacteriaceae bacterium]|nr:hypothetical protein [Cyclobacteriaceae bacterium]
MKCVGVVVLMFMSFTAMCHGNDSTNVAIDRKIESRAEVRADRKLERQKVKIEREHSRMMGKMEKRTIKQKKTDRRVLIFLGISAAVLVKALSPGVE